LAAVTYTQYLSRRGFPPLEPGGRFTRYVFLAPWSAPGFHMFWRRWNPLAGFALFHLYVLLGGGRNHALATLTVFALAGVIHDALATLLLGAPVIILTAAWIFFGAASLLSRAAAPRLRFRKWPPPALILLNLSLIATGLSVGSVIQRLLLGRAAA